MHRLSIEKGVASMFTLQWNIENVVVPILVSLVEIILTIICGSFCESCRTYKKTVFSC